MAALGGLCAKMAKTVWPKFLLINRTACLTAPALLTQKTRCDVHSQFHHHKHRFCSSAPRPQTEKIIMYFVDRDGDRIKVLATVGDSLLDVAIKNDVDLEGACEGTLACSTCHLIFTPEHYEQLPEPPTDEEQDMLDLAFDLQETSRLGCQVVVTKQMEGWEVTLPSGVADARGPS